MIKCKTSMCILFGFILFNKSKSNHNLCYLKFRFFYVFCLQNNTTKNIIFLTGKEGTGKTILTKHVSMEWADSPVGGLRKFGFVFPIVLKDVRSNDNIEDIIVVQHKGLSVNKVKSSETKAILGGETDSKVLLIMDRHYQYEPGINTDIDNLVEMKSLWNCCVIVTSRDTNIRTYMDCEVEVHGFDQNTVRDYVQLSKMGTIYYKK